MSICLFSYSNIIFIFIKKIIIVYGLLMLECVYL